MLWAERLESKCSACSKVVGANSNHLASCLSSCSSLCVHASLIGHAGVFEIHELKPYLDGTKWKIYVIGPTQGLMVQAQLVTRCLRSHVQLQSALWWIFAFRSQRPLDLDRSHRPNVAIPRPPSVFARLFSSPWTRRLPRRPSNTLFHRHPQTQSLTSPLSLRCIPATTVAMALIASTGL